jgi:predicted MFS family arabinose efflux permease
MPYRHVAAAANNAGRVVRNTSRPRLTPVNVAEPLLAVGPLHAGGSGFSILLTVFGVGAVLGSAFTSRLGSDVSVLRAHFLCGIAVCAVATLACAVAGGLASALAPFALFGFSNSLIANPENRLIQELAPDAFRGRVFGLRDSAESTCFALAFVAGGGLLSAVGPRTVYLLSAVLLMATAAVAVAAVRLSRPQVRMAEALAAESAA